MPLNFPSNNAFFVSPTGLRAQKQIRALLSKEHIQNQTAVLIGPAVPFLSAFEQNHPDILLEEECLPENSAFVSLPAAGTVSFVFTAALNVSVLNALPFLIKETHRILKPRGKFFLFVKNTPHFLSIQDVPCSCAKTIRNDLLQTGFIIHKQQGVLHLPFCGKFADLTDDCLFSLRLKSGAFTFFAVEKKPFISQTSETYNSARITKASVFTSPRT